MYKSCQNTIDVNNLIDLPLKLVEMKHKIESQSKKLKIYDNMPEPTDKRYGAPIFIKRYIAAPVKEQAVKLIE